jgi:predicted NodU family carbamoyl transferase
MQPQCLQCQPHDKNTTHNIILAYCLNLLLLLSDGPAVTAAAALPGEAYDKIARMLGLEMNPHGGAALERLARTGDPFKFKFAVPMKKHANCEFSFAGLKTSVRLCIEKELGAAQGKGKSVINPTSQRAAAAAAAGSSRSSSSSSSSSSAAGSSPDRNQQQQQDEEEEPLTSSSSSNPTEQQQHHHQQQQQTKADIAASFQRVATEHLVGRLKRGLSWAQEECPGLDTLVVAGGVAANTYIREQLGQVRGGRCWGDHTEGGGPYRGSRWGQAPGWERAEKCLLCG